MLKSIILKKLNDSSHLIKKTPNKKEFSTIIKTDSIFYSEDGKPIGAYLILPEKIIEPIRNVVNSTKMTKTGRTWGVPTQSSVFGSLPRNPLRVDFCRFSASSEKEKENFNTVRNFSKILANFHEKIFPENYLEALEEAKQIGGSWLMPETPYATCNFNVNHAIKYHRDSGNLKRSFSNVLILREGVTGGQLVLPEYGIALAQQDRALTIFSGQSEIHGVMPIKMSDENSYRASIVYYTLAGMKHCYPFQEELERVRSVRVKRENKRLTNSRPELEVIRRSKK